MRKRWNKQRPSKQVMKTKDQHKDLLNVALQVSLHKKREMFRKNTIESLKAKALHRYCRLLDTNYIHYILTENKAHVTRVGYRNPVPVRHLYLCNRNVQEPNQNADFGASFRCHAWAISWNICPLFLRNGCKKHHHRPRTWKIISRLRKCMWTQFGKL